MRTATRFMVKRVGGWRKLAEATRAHKETLRLAAGKGGVSAGLALRVARAAGVQLEDALVGKFPAAGTCPHCKRC